MAYKPFSQACENNKEPILQVIRQFFNTPAIVWEIGSGTGQHACYFAGQLPHIVWQPTDREENIPGIRLWCDDACLDNLKPPLPLDITQAMWPCSRIDALFTANTLHIMSWHQVEVLFDRLAEKLNPGAIICIYGPFNYHGLYTSHSNASFDLWLKDRDALSGIRDFEAVNALASSKGIGLIDDVAMPANNRLLVMHKKDT
ncbi:MAG: DUF938 domain-containing protein [Methylovulum sp.]|nr:DUF938 domain-containing protein [Methylovulum sp.]